jgi:hypothetical protein
MQTQAAQVKEIEVSILKPISEDGEHCIVVSRFRDPLVTNGGGLLDVHDPKNTNRALICLGCDQRVTLPVEVLHSVNWGLRTNSAGVKTRFECKCGHVIDIAFSWSDASKTES